VQCSTAHRCQPITLITTAAAEWWARFFSRVNEKMNAKQPSCTFELRRPNLLAVLCIKMTPWTHKKQASSGGWKAIYNALDTAQLVSVQLIRFPRSMCLTHTPRPGGARTGVILCAQRSRSRSYQLAPDWSNIGNISREVDVPPSRILHM